MGAHRQLKPILFLPGSSLPLLCCLLMCPVVRPLRLINVSMYNEVDSLQTQFMEAGLQHEHEQSFLIQCMLLKLRTHFLSGWLLWYKRLQSKLQGNRHMHSSTFPCMLPAITYFPFILDSTFFFLCMTWQTQRQRNGKKTILDCVKTLMQPINYSTELSGNRINYPQLT